MAGSNPWGTAAPAVPPGAGAKAMDRLPGPASTSFAPAPASYRPPIQWDSVRQYLPRTMLEPPAARPSFLFSPRWDDPWGRGGSTFSLFQPRLPTQRGSFSLPEPPPVSDFLPKRPQQPAPRPQPAPQPQSGAWQQYLAQPFGAPVAPGMLAPITVDWNPASWVDVRQFGARGDGSTDDTEAFRRAAASGKNLLVPNTGKPYLVSGRVPLRSSIVGQGMPQIRMQNPSGNSSSDIFYVDRYDGPGMTIRGLHLNGGWNGQRGGGEWSHGVDIRNSRNVAVEGNFIEKMQGDGISLGEGGLLPNQGGTPAYNVVIRGNRLGDSYRTNIAAIYAKGVKVADNDLFYNSGYVSSIDFEPEPGFSVNDALIENNRFHVPYRFSDWNGVISIGNDQPVRGVTLRNNSGNITNNWLYAPGSRSAAFTQSEPFRTDASYRFPGA